MGEVDKRIWEHIEMAKRLGLQVERRDNGTYIIRHPKGITARAYGRVALAEFLRGYEFNEEANGYIIQWKGEESL